MDTDKHEECPLVREGFKVVKQTTLFGYGNPCSAVFICGCSAASDGDVI
jgi:hypothetical protein